MTRDETAEGFEFSVSVRPMTLDYLNITDMWSVELPHQCDEWGVAFGSKTAAIEQLTRFIADAQEALTTLKDLDACPHDWYDDGGEHVNNAGTQRRFKCRICRAAVFRTVDTSTAAPWFIEQYYTGVGFSRE